jgi:recombination protein RecT
MSTALATKEKSEAIIKQIMPQLLRASVSGMDMDRFAQSYMTAVATVPKLLECSKLSVAQSLMQCARLGFYPDGVLGHAWILPYKGHATLIPGYRGLIELAYRSGKVSNIDTHWVREGDHFEYRYGLTPDLTHVPCDKPGALTAAYAVATMTDGSKQFTVITRDDAMETKSRSQSANSQYSPWNHKDDEKWMWAKTAVRRLCKLLPLSPESQWAVRQVERVETGQDPVQVDLAGFDILPEPEPQPEVPMPKALDDGPTQTQDRKDGNYKTVTGCIEKVGQMNSKPESKKPWTRWTFFMADSDYSFQTFSETKAASLVPHVGTGQSLVIETEPDPKGKYKDELVGFSLEGGE